MEAIKCSRGHYYDKALGSCPVCAAESGNQRSPFVTGSEVPDDIPTTTPATGGGFDIGATIPATTPGFTPTDLGGVQPKGGNVWDIEDYGNTAPASFNGEEAFDPIVGWLICVKGSNRGKDYASVSYDVRERVFYIAKGEVRNPTYLNGRALRSDADLVAYDRIEIGNTELIFVPLCNDQFNWQDL